MSPRPSSHWFCKMRAHQKLPTLIKICQVSLSDTFELCSIVCVADLTACQVIYISRYIWCIYLDSGYKRYMLIRAPHSGLWTYKRHRQTDVQEIILSANTLKVDTWHFTNEASNIVWGSSVWRLLLTRLVLFWVFRKTGGEKLWWFVYNCLDWAAVRRVSSWVCLW